MADPWKKASSVADLGNLMADWLEGRGSSWPGYESGAGPDDETRHLIPVLAAANRAGYVTTCSQPGQMPERGYDRRMWRQRAAVEGWVADRRLLDRLRTGAKHAGLEVIAHRPGVQWHDGIPVTEVDREPYTWFARTDGHRNQIAYEWPGVGGRAVRELRKSTYLTLIDPVWGRDDRLWPALANAIH